MSPTAANPNVPAAGAGAAGTRAGAAASTSISASTSPAADARIFVPERPMRLPSPNSPNGAAAPWPAAPQVPVPQAMTRQVLLSTVPILQKSEQPLEHP